MVQSNIVVYKKYLNNNYMVLKTLGINSDIESYIKSNELSNFEIGRVVKENKKNYTVKTQSGDFISQI